VVLLIRRKNAQCAWKVNVVHGGGVEIIAVSEIYEVCVSLECGGKHQMQKKYMEVCTVQYRIRCSLCRLIILLSSWCRAAVFFSASGAAVSQVVLTVK
jgi:hypothetical protein